jgi:hypothetical protein
MLRSETCSGRDRHFIISQVRMTRNPTTLSRTEAVSAPKLVPPIRRCGCRSRNPGARWRAGHRLISRSRRFPTPSERRAIRWRCAAQLPPHPVRQDLQGAESLSRGLVWQTRDWNLWREFSGPWAAWICRAFSSAKWSASRPLAIRVRHGARSGRLLIVAQFGVSCRFTRHRLVRIGVVHGLRTLLVRGLLFSPGAGDTLI